MIELMVVVGIIIVLLGLIVSVAQRTIESAKQRQTKIILTVLDNAIQEFADEGGGRGPFQARRATDPDYDAFFGPFPPIFDRYAGYHAHVDPDPSGRITDYFWRTRRLWQRIDDPAETYATYSPDMPGAVVLDQALYVNHLDNAFAATNRDDLENIQGLYFYLRRFSPGAAALLSNIPEKYVTNTGIYAPRSPTFNSGVDVLGDSPANIADDMALVEVGDPWDSAYSYLPPPQRRGTLLSYWVYFFREDPTSGVGQLGVYGDDIANEVLIDPLPVIESAGPDGKFGHRPGEPVDPTDPDAVKAAADNLFSREPPWR